MPRASEDHIAFGVLQIAAASPKGVATFARLKKEIPDLVTLSEGDLIISTTRPNEPMWHQIVRNIKSHHEADGNYISNGYLVHVPGVGYRITDAGRALP